MKKSLIQSAPNAVHQNGTRSICCVPTGTLLLTAQHETSMPAPRHCAQLEAPQVICLSSNGNLLVL